MNELADDLPTTEDSPTDASTPIAIPAGSSRLVLLAVLLLCSSTLIAAGVAGWSWQAGLIVGGMLLAGWSWLLFGELT